MPHHEISTNDVLCKTKDRKSSKKHSPRKHSPRKCSPRKHSPRKHSPRKCNVECVLPECNPECCTPGFQRLDKLRTEWLLVQNGLLDPVTSVYNRAAQVVDVSGYEYPLERTSAGFVNVVRYLNYEECGKSDQVTGWSVDVQTGDLKLYQNLPDLGLSTEDSRADILNTVPTNLTPYDRRKLSEFEPFWKLSLKAIERVRENPKTEGNICEIKDKCGNRFLVAINRTASQALVGTEPAQSICEYNSKYTVVVVKLC